MFSTHNNPLIYFQLVELFSFFGSLVKAKLNKNLQNLLSEYRDDWVCCYAN